MRFIENKKLAARIGVITTAITLIGMMLLWLVVSTNAASMVKTNIIPSELKDRKEWLPCFAVAPPGASKTAEIRCNISEL